MKDKFMNFVEILKRTFKNSAKVFIECCSFPRGEEKEYFIKILIFLLTVIQVCFFNYNSVGRYIASGFFSLSVVVTALLFILFWNGKSMNQQDRKKFEPLDPEIPNTIDRELYDSIEYVESNFDGAEPVYVVAETSFKAEEKIEEECTVEEQVYLLDASTFFYFQEEGIKNPCEAGNIEYFFVTRDVLSQLSNLRKQGKFAPNKELNSFMYNGFDLVVVENNPAPMPEFDLLFSGDFNNIKRSNFKLIWDAIGLGESEGKQVILVTQSGKLNELARQNMIIVKHPSEVFSY